jgi:endonuclease/exonuclease/phosphatase family metal-dependent hydrolase
MRQALYTFFLICPLWTGPLAAEVRVATFNIAMGFERAGEMAAALGSGDHERLRMVAEILQRVRPDIVLLNEFDYDPAVDAAELLNRNYLAVAAGGREAIRYPFHFRAPVNTGVDSGLDLDGDGKTGGPGDAWGFGRFPGQYGMLVLSRYPLAPSRSRTFQYFRWADLPGASRPVRADGTPFHPDASWSQLRLSSKSHWDLVFDVEGVELHLLASHPTPPVFDGPEDRNGRRNFDEIRFWREYTSPGGADWIRDDAGTTGGIAPGSRFVIAGDLNADPQDGDSRPGAIAQLLGAPWIDASCGPSSSGGVDAAREQGGANDLHRGDPAQDTADFDDRRTGNLRLDYVLPSANLQVRGCGVFWPAPGQIGFDPGAASDHRLVWLDILL